MGLVPEHRVLGGYAAVVKAVVGSLGAVGVTAVDLVADIVGHLVERDVLLA